MQNRVIFVISDFIQFEDKYVGNFFFLKGMFNRLSYSRIGTYNTLYCKFCVKILNAVLNLEITKLISLNSITKKKLLVVTLQCQKNCHQKFLMYDAMLFQHTQLLTIASNNNDSFHLNFGDHGCLFVRNRFDWFLSG